MGIFGKHGQHEGTEDQEREDLTQYVHDTIRHMPHDDTGGRLGEEEGAGAEIMAEALEGFERHVHHPEWHPGSPAGTTPSDTTASDTTASDKATADTATSRPVPSEIENETGEPRP